MGNRLTSTETTGNWSYNQNNELGGFDDTGYVYDDNGNMIQKTVAGVVTNYVYNVEDRLTEVRNGSGSLISSYYYDPFGRRLWKEVGGTRTWFHYADEGLIGEYDATGAEIKTYGYKPGSTWTTDPLFMKVGSEYYFYQNDHLGTPQKLTGVNGAVVWSAKYESFGKCAVDAGATVENNLRYSGQFEDVETGLHYNGHRFYNPRLGRYIKSDPSHHLRSQKETIPYLIPELIFTPLEMHDYTYVQNNSNIKIDPLGLATYLCKKPLDNLQKYVGGKGQRTGPDVDGNLLYHAYLCVEKNGTIVCGGQTSVGGEWYGPGAQSDDVYIPSRCEKVAINKCIEDCILRKFPENRPYYGLKGPGTNCQEWARDTFDSCKDACF